MSPAAIMPELLPGPSLASRFGDLRGVRWRINLGVLPSSLSNTVDDLRRVTADSRRRYAVLRRRLLIDPHVPKFSDDSSDLVIDNPLSQSPESTWGRFFRNAELEQMVDKDLSRLYPEHGSYFQTPGCQGLLRRILLLWCLRHPECGYRQGMHELLAPLLYVLHADIQHLNNVSNLYEDHFVDKFDEVLLHESHDFSFKMSSNALEDADTDSQDRSRKHASLSDLDANIQTIVLLSDPYGAEGELGIVLSDKFMEHDAYSMFDALMNGSGGTVSMAEFFSHSSLSATQTGLAPVVEASLALYHLLSIVDSSLYTHLVELGVEPQYFALRWLRVLFGREFSLEDLLVIWDEIFSFDNRKSVNSVEEHDSGILNSPRGAFISSMAVSMMLNVRSSLLATEYTASCLQRLLNFPENVDLGKLIGKAKSLVGLAMKANAPSHSTSVVKGHSHSHIHSISMDSSSPRTPVSPVPERYWEEKWRVIHQEEETKNENSPKQVSSSKRKSWTEKMKLRLSRTGSDPLPSRKESRDRVHKSSVRRSLIEDLSRQLNFGDDTEETGHDRSSSHNLSCTKTGKGTQTGTGMENGNSPEFQGGWDVPKYPNEDVSGTGNGNYMSTGTETENSNSPKFKGGFGCWDVTKYPNGDVSGTRNGNCMKLSCSINRKDPLSIESDAVVQDDAAYIGKTSSGLSSGSEEHSPVFSDPASPVENDSEKSSIDDGTQNFCSFQSTVKDDDPLPISVAPDANACLVSGTNDSPRGPSPLVVVSKERKTLSGKFQWIWKFSRHSSGEGTSDKRVEPEDAKSDIDGNLQGNETSSNPVNIKTDGCDQNLMCTLRNLGQSMLENIQAIESAFQQEGNQTGSLDHFSKHGLVGKGQVTAMTALKELRNISNLLRGRCEAVWLPPILPIQQPVHTNCFSS